MPDITGETRLYAIVGDPVAQVRAPMVFNALFDALGVNARMVAFHIAADDLGAALDGLHRLRNLDGLVITIPHKVAILPHLAELAPMAARSGAVNLVRRRPEGGWIGEMVDGLGFAEGLHTAGHAIEGRTVLLVGAGGAGAAIAFALAARGCGEIAIFDLDRTRAHDLATRLRADGQAARPASDTDPASFQIVINATPMGMKPDDPLPFDITRVDPGAVVAEVIMKPRVTRLIELARTHGNPTVLGERMLDYQAPFALEFFGLTRG